jgi:hypothetical protein
MSLLLLFRKAVQTIIAPVATAPEYYLVDLLVHETDVDLATPMMAVNTNSRWHRGRSEP